MTPNILIIGGGIIGLASALQLHSDGARVTVLERNAIGQEASWAGGGILSPLLPWHYPEGLSGLCAASATMFPDWLDGLRTPEATDPEYWACGMRVLPPFDMPQLPPIHPLYTYEIQDETLQLPNVAQARNPRLLRYLHEAVLHRGITLLEYAGDAHLVSDSQAVQHVVSAHGHHTADAYVVAAGAWSQHVLAAHPPRKTIAPIRGQMLLFEANIGVLNEILYRQGIYLIPRRDGHILAGSTLEDVGFDKGTTEAARHHLWQQALSMLPTLRNVRIERQWSGLRPGSPNNIPTIARHPHISNLYLNAGHFRYGVTLSPISARLLSDLIMGRSPCMDTTPYAWETA